MNAPDLLHLTVRPCLRWLADRTGLPLASPEAEVCLLAFAIQESELRWRRQQPSGPARSWWQIEDGNERTSAGCYGALNNPSAVWLHDACRCIGYTPVVPVVHAAIEHNDVLACCVARALLWCDRSPLPRLGDEAAAYQCYDQRVWRPGAKRPRAWARSYALAVEAVLA